MDPRKVNAVVDWPQQTSRVQLHRFLDLCKLLPPFHLGLQHPGGLSALTSPKIPFKWSPAVDKAFEDLKHWFTTAPILIHPDPLRQFVAEVDASDVGVVAILSQ